jgi:hypothetical protein
MKNNIKLIFNKEDTKNIYFDALKKQAKIPFCRNCGNLFQLSFPNTEEGVCDYLICQENLLLCECEYFNIVRNLYNQKGESLVDITPYYKVEE